MSDVSPATTRRALSDRIASVKFNATLQKLPDGLLKPGVVLRDYQLKGVQWMHAMFAADGVNGGILADEMGLGKTLQTIAFLAHLNQSPKSRRFLIVTPLSVLENWNDEFQKFCVSNSVCRVIKYTGTKEERASLREQIKDNIEFRFDAMLVTYETVTSDIAFVQSFEWDVLVVDEAHRLKNPLSLLHTTLLTLSPPPFKLLLTGTPVQNNLNELESLLAFCCPSIFGASSPPSGTLQTLYGCGANESEKNALLQELNELIRPFMLRREKESVLTLPPMKETVLYTPMSDLQKTLYKSILTKNMAVFDTGRKTGLMNILMQLRKCCNHPYLFDGIEPEPFEAGDHLFTSSGKLLVLDHLLAHLHSTNHRVLLFSQMTQMLNILQDYLTYRGYSHVRLDGSIRGQDRHTTVTEFSSPSSDTFVFLLSTRAGGVGLNLTAADTVIFFDSDFNPMMDMQAAARAHRIGQTRRVEVVRLVTEGSVEEVVLRRAKGKRVLSEKVVGGGSGGEEGSGVEEGKAGSDLVAVLRFGVAGLVGGDGGGVSVEKRAEELVEKYVCDAAETGGEDSNAVQEDASIYLYEGTDLKKDEDAFAQLKEEMGVAESNEETESAKQRALEQSDRAAALKLRREERQREAWLKMGYESFALAEDLESVMESEEEEEEEVDDAGKYFVYKTGSITDPDVGQGEVGIIVQLSLFFVVDDSGNWPARGVFAALSQMDGGIEEYYSASSGAAKNLALGSAHLLPTLIPVNSGGHVQVCLLVAQKRGRDGSLGNLRFPDLESGLMKVGKAAKLMGDIRLKRIAFLYGIRDAAKRLQVKEFVTTRGGDVMDGWDPSVVNLVVVEDIGEKEDLSEGCKSGVVILTVEELLES
ncbi:Chromodomain-helicase-DNA-binding protein 1-like [Podochytrium sp. JEL0797]|nr:Chromodomain-helicase-DNA-binding protein 1-like [Podochytrium sp. JEL0797]